MTAARFFRFFKVAVLTRIVGMQERKKLEKTSHFKAFVLACCSLPISNQIFTFNNYPPPSLIKLKWLTPNSF